MPQRRQGAKPEGRTVVECSPAVQGCASHPAERDLWLHAWASAYRFRRPDVQTDLRNTLLRA
jgi:hypothetical protein